MTARDPVCGFRWPLGCNPKCSQHPYCTIGVPQPEDDTEDGAA